MQVSPDIKKVYDAIKEAQGADAYVLVGGSALSMQAQHRFSRDLDFASTGKVLDQVAIKGILDTLKSKGFEIVFATDTIAIEEAENEGVNLKEHQQDWLVDGVKVTFFSVAMDDRDVLSRQKVTHDGNIKVMDKDGLFITKCIALMDRVKSRDIYDLWWFVMKSGKNIADIFNTIQERRPHVTYESIRYRLLDWPLPITDEGIEASVDVDFASIREDLREQVAALEVRLASTEINRLRQNKP